MLTLTIDDAAARLALAKMQLRMQDTSAAMADMGEELVSRIVDGFEREADPWGKRWAPLKQATAKGRARRFKTASAKRKARTDQRILQDTGTLRSSIEIQSVGADHVSVWSRTPYTRAHQFGVPSRNLPARPFFPVADGGAVDLPAEWRAAVLDLLRGHLER